MKLSFQVPNADIEALLIVYKSCPKPFDNTLLQMQITSVMGGVDLAVYAEVAQATRDAPPSHYSLKIQSFSKLSELPIQKYKSKDFEMGGFKWNLVLHPNGDKDMNVNDHISLYLAIADTKPLRSDWEVNVVCKFFVFDQIRDNYLILGDAEGRVRRFHGIRKKWGFSKLISLTAFKLAENGFLVDDNCEFGVEILIIHRTSGSESLSLLKTAACYYHTWKIEYLSEYKDSPYICSNPFTAGAYNWRMRLYHKGEKEAENKNLSLYLYLDNFRERVYAEIRLRLKNQTNDKHLETHGYYWFKNSSDGRGERNFVAIDDFKDRSKGYVVRDTCIIEAEITVYGLRE